ncbi:MAG TPA: chromosome segregation protein SMC [Hydrogenophilus thermoluteolus]|nr:chromosome segregation protein SMC [Hydrogenophilus thermoluteolus]
MRAQWLHEVTMRLSRIRLAGFKTFVEPTVIAVDAPFVAIVGPNGCGKSNVIDAVRWVLGETRASSMRAQTMSDVIFNGSAERKPAARASVELIFDNLNEARVGAWARFETLSVRRILTRDGESSYWLNGQRVRRRDVLDLFLGTGLGPRAYAIIEQGMVNRLIEAKPEELRHLLEEAAGVTRYRERRKETEAKLQEAEAHLARLRDQLATLRSNEARLQAEAETAKTWRKWTAQKTRTERLLWALRRVRAERALAEAECAEREAEKQLAEWREQQTALSQERAAAQTAFQDASHALEAAQQHYYQIQAQVVELRHQAQNAAMRQTALAQERETILAERARWAAEQTRVTEALHAAQEEVAVCEARWEELLEAWDAAQEALQAAERVAQQKHAVEKRLQHERDQLDRRLAQVRLHRQTAERQQQKIFTQRAHLRQELESHDDAPADLAPLLAEQAAVQEQRARLERALAQSDVECTALDTETRQADEALRSWREQRAEVAGRVRSLEKALSRHRNAAAKAHAAEKPELWQQIDVAPEYANAVAAALTPWMQSIAATPDGVLPKGVGSCAVRRDAVPERTPNDPPKPPEGVVALHSVITTSDPALASWLRAKLDNVWLTETLTAAIDAWVVARHAIVVTRDGGQLTPWGWIPRNESDSAAQEATLLEQRAELAEWQQRLVAIEKEIESAEQHAALCAERYQIAREKGEALRAEQRQITQHEQKLALQLAQRKEQLAWAKRWRAERLARLAELDAEWARLHDEIAERNDEEEALLEQLALLDEALERARTEARVAQSAWQEAQQNARTLEHEKQALAAQQQQMTRHCTLLAESLTRTETERQRLESRLAELDREAAALDTGPAPETVRALEAQLDQAEQAVRGAREAVKAAEAHFRAAEQQAQAHEQARNALETAWQQAHDARVAAEMEVARWQEALAAAEVDWDALRVQVPHLDEQQLANELERLTQAIDALGPVNHAAFAALEALTQEIDALQRQVDDIAAAEQTLREAIRTIDKETREALQQTHRAVNRAFSERFSQLFGGGQAQLALTGDEILDAGAQIIAQPPGKKNGTIQLLSGGEKALTAIALVFAFFDLNPAPFCILDEVDAPLDDANTQRYAALIRTMAERTQFLVITHNKLTMAAADRLVGVTMREQGVSRTVDVDVERAVQLAQPAV